MKSLPLAAAILVMAGLGAASAHHDYQIVNSGGADRLVIRTSADAKKFTDNSFEDLTVINSIAVPDGVKGNFVASFTGESTCDGPVGSWCSVRIVCDGKELHPAQGNEFVFSSAGKERSVSATMTRRSDNVKGGTYECKVQAATAGGAVRHTLDDWTFMVKFWQRLDSDIGQ